MPECAHSLMKQFLRFVPLALMSCLAVVAHAQQPRAYLKFDGDLADSSGAGIITAVTPSAGFVPTFTTDRNGQPNQAIVFTGSQSLQLVADSLPGNSNQALGLRNAAGTNTSFTVAAWVYFDSVSGQGFNTIFGNAGSGAGTLHAGLGSNSSFAHFGFDAGNDANGANVGIVAGQWYHLAFVYTLNDASQRIYINGVPEIVRFSSQNTLRQTDLLIGNWGATNHATNDLRGRLDDVVVFNSALNGGQIHGLFNGVAATALSTTYSGPKLPGVPGTAGNWGIREIKSYPGIVYGTLVNADRVVRAYAATPGGIVQNYQSPVVNFVDPQSGASHSFPNDANFRTDTAADDNNFMLIAKCAVRIPVEADYTFGFRGDDGSRLRVIGAQFISSTRLQVTNPANPAHFGDGLYFTNGTGDSQTLGVVHLRPGDYNLEFVWWEGSGGSSVEVFAAQGIKTSIDGSFQLIGNTAAGGLEIVEDPDIVPTLTANGAGSLFVHGGAPANFTLAWSVPDPGTTLSIDQGIGPVPQSGSQLITSPAQTTTYTITATTGSIVINRSVTVYVDAPPVLTLSANDTTVASGAAVTLSWNAQGAASLTLQPGNIDVTGQTSRVVNPTADTTYTLSATNPAGTTQRSVVIDVGEPPLINSFTVADPNPIYGQETTLSWDVSNAVTLSINQGIGTLPGNTGSVSISPLQTTTYTLTATNDYAAATATATVNQATPIGVAAPGFAIRRVSSTAGNPFPYAGQGYLQSALSLLGGQNAGATTTRTDPTVNLLDGADGEFPIGNLGFPGGAGDNYALQITATLVVNAPGEYTFVVNSDDGSRLRIDGEDVIVDDGTHVPGSKTGRISLTKPTAQLELIHFDATGGSEVELGWIRPNLSWQLLTVIAPAPPIVRGQLLISEFMAENQNTLLDEDNEPSDWIEIWNSTNAPVDLSGYFLTDDAAVLNKWPFPAKTLAPNEYLVVFASSKNRRDPAAALHTNFRLATTGEYLALTQNNGAGGYNIISAFAPTFPPQREDVSYGSSDTEGYVGYMETPTPGTANAATVVGFVEDLTFSHLRGRYSAPFTLTIATATPGATIRYTTNGSTPAANNGTVYTGPIAVNGTTALRAAAFKPGWKAADIETHTYLFVDDIVSQTNATATALGFPLNPINGQRFRYGLTLGNVTAAGGTLQSLKDALAAAPTVCLTTDVGNLVTPATGIYVNPGRHGLFWERPVSMEYINAAGTSEFQIDCGFRIRGGFSRDVNNPKHAFHMYFRDSLYEGDLEYRLFGAAGASEFSQIDLRCEHNYSWAYQNDGRNTLMREEWSRLAQRDMGQPYARTGYFHLYINSIYWGVYNWEERTEAQFGETYLGGDSDNIDVVKSAGSSGGYNTEMTDGNFRAWQLLNTKAIALKNDLAEAGRTARYLELLGRNPDGTPNPAFPVLLDPDNLIDYLLNTFYSGSFDAPMSTFLSNASNNWFGIRDRLGARGFAFFVHDFEHGMDSMVQSYNRVGPWGGTGNNNWGQGQYGTRENFLKSNPHYLHELLAYSAEYRQRFADRAQRHLFNDGALSTPKSIARLNGLIAEVDPIIHAEAARWGSASLNRNSWLGARNAVTNFINNGGSPQGGQTVFGAQPRASMIAAQLRGYTDAGPKPLFSTLLAPTISAPFGGPVPNPHMLTITNPNATGAVYYTVNGPDPRATGGSIDPAALTAASPVSLTLTSTSTVRARIFDSATSQWSPIVDPEFLVGALASPTNLVISKIHYNPSGVGDGTEFVEVMNIGAGTIDLTNVQFTLGIQFQFPDAYQLTAGGRALIVRDSAAFIAAYGGGLAAQIAGVFANGTSLDNGGERIQLLDAAGAVIRDFSYDNKSPWPTGPDGEGPALVLKRPELNPDHANPANWRASTAVGGTPGNNDAESYAAWAAANGITDLLGTADDDLDGLSNLLEYYLGSNPRVASLTARPVVGTETLNVDGVIGDYLTLTFKRAVGHDDVSGVVEASSDLTTWVAAVLVPSPTYNGDGTETVTFRYPQPRSANPEQFLRLRATRL